MINKVINSLHSAAADTSRLITSRLRDTASDHGWHPDAVNSLSAKYEPGKGFSVHTTMHDEVHALEYGTESSAPTAVLRKFDNSPHSVEASNYLLSTAMRRKS